MIALPMAQIGPWRLLVDGVFGQLSSGPKGQKKFKLLLSFPALSWRERENARHQTDDWDRSIHRSIDRSIDRSINQSTNQPINQWTHQPINPSTNQPITSPSARVRMQYPNSRKCQKYQSQQQRVPRVGLTLQSVHHSYKSATVYCSKPAWGPSGQPLWRPC